MKRSFRKLLCAMFFAVSMFFLYGCASLFSTANVPACYYDLGLPEKISASYAGNICVEPFTSLSGEKFRMVRRKGNMLYNDNYNKWQMSPGALVTKYFTLAFRTDEKKNAGKKTDILLGGEVTAFEESGGQAVLGLSYHIASVPGKDGGQKWKRKRSILIKEKIRGNTPGDFASAMSRAMENASEIIIKDIDSK